MLAVTTPEPIDHTPFIKAFARQCRDSREYQGHGFGVAWRDGDAWSTSHDLTPIWKATLPAVPPTTLMLVHARSAFRDKGIMIEHNMPFIGRGGLVFAFNGELRGVRLRAPGPNGAWRLFHLLNQLRESVSGDVGKAVQRLDAMIHDRSEYVRALNLIVSDGRQVWINNHFAEDPEYFTMHTGHAVGPEGQPISMIASEPFEPAGVAVAWHAVSRQSTFALPQPAGCSS